MTIITKLLGGRPMTRIRGLFTDVVQGKPVNLYEDSLGRRWMANSKWSWFRVPYDSKWEEPCPPVKSKQQLMGLYAPDGTETGTDFVYKKYADQKCGECNGWGEFHVPYEDYDTYIIHRCDCSRRHH